MSDPGNLVLAAAKPSTYVTEKWWALALLAGILILIVIVPFLLDLAWRRWRIARLRPLATSPPPQGVTKEESEAARKKLKRWERPPRIGLLGAIMGEDGRLSTTKSVALLWTLVIAYVLLALILVWPADWSVALGNLNGAYLALLGGPIATVVLSKTIVSSRMQRGTIQKPAGDGIPRLGDLVADDSGDTDLFDLQYLLFNLVAVLFVLVGFSKATLSGFPPVPDVLWLLTGGPAAVFVSNKAFGTNAPAIFSVDPARVRPKQPFTVYGQNFTVGDAPAKVSVQVNGVKATVEDVTAVSLRALVPDDLPPSESAMITVITDAGVMANRVGMLTIVRDPAADPLSAGLIVAPGGTFLLTGAWTPGPQGVTVLVNGVAATTANVSGNAVTVTVPPGTPTGAAQVVVLDSVGHSGPVTLTVG